MKYGKWFRGVIVLIVVWTQLTTLSYGGDIYHGTVVDEETGKPLEGASVTVVWYRTPIVQLERSLYFQSAQETVTDAEGKFSLEVAPGVDWSPFTKLVEGNDIVIFKPGYWPFEPSRMPKEFWGYEAKVAAFKRGVEIKLNKCKVDEFKKCAGSLGLPRVPDEKIPNLIRNLNLQRKMAGFQS